MASDVELTAMRHAIALSACGFGTTGPNPPVGCVVLNSRGAIVGRGYHRRKGEAHAEVRALSDAGPAARGGTAVVTLEPCNHVGVTPACRQALIDAEITRVVISLIDPTSRGDGGAAMLTAAGIDVETDVLRDETLAVLGPWLTATLRRRPYVIWAYALDDGQDDAMTAQLVRYLRASADVIAVNKVPDEGIPGGHSAAHFRLPANADFDTGLVPWLTAAYSGGARSVLLAGHGYADAIRDDLHAVDEIIIAVRRNVRVPTDATASFELVAVWPGWDWMTLHFRQHQREEM
ncbi:bifunctional diaminohydroxyphosphoribosylaminopyrimidine deaminase/5-amino-6-(5-phosphoribosylamino)uracil reductase RibD [Micromonospora sp. WMMD1082]|uniref:bifunctional diaminohydroxyphosphoribosylaminopyrimidine deaminase/5-amino-6-(5-phosphoribosylamino)uracil reductase RibD n=1 Tax=Micromonospora sp. WMMD1082 TaxID=3016104 RepID=UPI002415AB19|nr:bifunctional diaminohydroxyphosphoribosylaminopyrimidine deaminase/5-amino-6-(5-phosphoribosylamino)uracil reductase RibD [Micromonospora sp. WMMD1082]MDG4795165.1 bifunctional diaminohydroxyphosphoribosylaminopyrimidine deaminase/5-amino-6-(5-phosphoribosylamino)uracil reductase RibD [Micromonospora sp. WMMD1082]